MVHVLSGYLSTVVLGPEDPVPVPAICKALSEMGLNGLDIVVHGDQENLLESVFRDSAKHRTFVGRSMHWVPFAVNRPQAKGIVERNICLVKEAFWSVWLGLEERPLQTGREQRGCRFSSSFCPFMASFPVG